MPFIQLLLDRHERSRSLRPLWLAWLVQRRLRFQRDSISSSSWTKLPSSTSTSPSTLTSSNLLHLPLLIMSFTQSSYAGILLSTYIAKWGSFDLEHAIVLVRELALNNSFFHKKAFNPTPGEQEVLRHLSICASGGRGHWMPGRRPLVIPDRHQLQEPVDHIEVWNIPSRISESAKANDLPISYEKFFREDGPEVGPIQIVYTAELGNREPRPRDELDAINAWFDYVRTDKFAREHGPLTRFEFDTLRRLKRNIQCWRMEAAGWNPNTMRSFIGFDYGTPRSSM